MKAIRVAMMAVALTAVATSASSAQQPEQAQTGAMGGMILRGITLTEAQKAQQKVIREKYAPQMMAVRKASQTTGTPMDQAKLTEIRAGQAAELRAILTAEQQVVFDRNMAEMRARRANQK